MLSKFLSLLVCVVVTLPCHCTAEWNKIIVGGQDADASRYRWMVSLQRPNNDFHFCGGALVAPDVVVTAAHCVTNTNFVVRVKGEGNSNLPFATTTFEVSKVVTHPLYTNVETGYDIAVVLLVGESAETPLDFSVTNNVYTGKDAKVIGWGTTSQGGAAAELLQEVIVPIQSQETCRKGYGARIDDTMICAGLVQGGVDACQGDSGGPLFLDEIGSKPLLIGVVSWGYGCAQPNRLGVYARVGYFGDWILKQIDLLHGITRVPTSSPTRSPLAIGTTHAPTTPKCEDKIRGWKDSDGYDCAWYADDNNCEKFGDDYENFGYVAQEACCVCGGGQVPKVSVVGVEAVELCSCDGGSGLYDQCGFTVPEMPDVAVCLLKYKGGRNDPPSCTLRGNAKFDFSNLHNRWFIRNCIPHARLADDVVSVPDVKLVDETSFGTPPPVRTVPREQDQGIMIAAGLGVVAGGTLATIGAWKLHARFQQEEAERASTGTNTQYGEDLVWEDSVHGSDKFEMFRTKRLSSAYAVVNIHRQSSLTPDFALRKVQQSMEEIDVDNLELED